jgi:hypothetical protein
LEKEKAFGISLGEIMKKLLILIILAMPILAQGAQVGNTDTTGTHLWLIFNGYAQSTVLTIPTTATAESISMMILPVGAGTVKLAIYRRITDSTYVFVDSGSVAVSTTVPQWVAAKAHNGASLTATQYTVTATTADANYFMREDENGTHGMYVKGGITNAFSNPWVDTLKNPVAYLDIYYLPARIVYNSGPALPQNGSLAQIDSAASTFRVRNPFTNAPDSIRYLYSSGGTVGSPTLFSHKTGSPTSPDTIQFTGMSNGATNPDTFWVWERLYYNSGTLADSDSLRCINLYVAPTVGNLIGILK